MKRTKSCLFECEYLSKTGCSRSSEKCPVVEFSGGDCCESCIYSYSKDGELYCNLVFELFDCPNGIANPLNADKLKQYRNRPEFYSNMKRFKFCFECEHREDDVCKKCINWKNDGPDCPVVEFVGAVTCANCQHSFFDKEECKLFCNLDWRMVDCPNGIDNPLPEKIVKAYRNDLIF